MSGKYLHVHEKQNQIPVKKNDLPKNVLRLMTRNNFLILEIKKYSTGKSKMGLTLQKKNIACSGQ